MLELIINAQKEEKEIELVKDGKLIEYYKERKDEERNEGNIYIGIVKDILNGMQSAFIDIGIIKNAFIQLKDILPKVNIQKENKEQKECEIKKVLKKNQKLLVQVKKDSNNLKGAKVSTHINIPSKYIVFTPNTDIITISQKIEDENEAQRLIELVKNNISVKNGAIIRTSAVGKTEEIIEDIKAQEAKWEKIKKDYENAEKEQRPILLYKSQSIIEKLLIDLLTNKLEKVIVNNKEDYKLVKDCITTNKELKELKIEVKDIEKIEGIYDLKKQKEKIEARKVWLKNGGFITIDKTEALTAIDVNTGKYTGAKSAEDTVFRVNKEATIEIAKQIRLRDIGGIIVIDYIDMKEEKNKQEIEKLLKQELKKDRTKTQIEGFTKLDLMELTRKHICSHKE